MSYINSNGLSVILKVHQVMKRNGGRVGLMNFQPHIQRVFDIVNALPRERVFATRHELDNYLKSVQNKYFAGSHLVKMDAGTDNNIIWAKNNSH